MWWWRLGIRPSWRPCLGFGQSRTVLADRSRWIECSRRQAVESVQSLETTRVPRPTPPYLVRRTSHRQGVMWPSAPWRWTERTQGLDRRVLAAGPPVRASSLTVRRGPRVRAPTSTPLDLQGQTPPRTAAKHYAVRCPGRPSGRRCPALRVTDNRARQSWRWLTQRRHVGLW